MTHVYVKRDFLARIVHVQVNVIKVSVKMDVAIALKDTVVIIAQNPHQSPSQKPINPQIRILSNQRKRLL